jgi:hypothetical protein
MVQVSAPWAVFFLNCCFLGISGMVLGACAAMTVPFLFRTLLNFFRKRCSKKDVNDFETYKFKPLLSNSSFITGQPGYGKRVIRLEV